MELFVLTCLEAQLILKNVNMYKLFPKMRDEVIEEVKNNSPKECKLK